MKNYIVNTWKMYLRGLQYIQITHNFELSLLFFKNIELRHYP